MGVWSSVVAFFRLKGKAARHVTAREAATMKEKGAYVVDVREPFEFKRGHVPGAVNIPLGEIEKRVAELPKDQPLVLHCALGARSTKAAAHLAQQGYDVVDLKGGFDEWKKEGLPVDREP